VTNRVLDEARIGVRPHRARPRQALSRDRSGLATAAGQTLTAESDFLFSRALSASQPRTKSGVGAAVSIREGDGRGREKATCTRAWCVPNSSEDTVPDTGELNNRLTPDLVWRCIMQRIVSEVPLRKAPPSRRAIAALRIRFFELNRVGVPPPMGIQSSALALGSGFWRPLYLSRRASRA
jgi:hypothetical protein